MCRCSPAYHGLADEQKSALADAHTHRPQVFQPHQSIIARRQQEKRVGSSMQREHRRVGSQGTKLLQWAHQRAGYVRMSPPQAPFSALPLSPSPQLKRRNGKTRAAILRIQRWSAADSRETRISVNRGLGMNGLHVSALGVWGYAFASLARSAFGVLGYAFLADFDYGYPYPKRLHIPARILESRIESHCKPSPGP